MADTFADAPVGSVVQPCPFANKEAIHWIEIELIGEDDKPIPWERYKVVLPDGRIVEGLLDDAGFVRIDQILPAGNCRVSFPDLDKEAVEFVRTMGPKPPKT
jgi:hypothetical protein